MKTFTLLHIGVFVFMTSIRFSNGLSCKDELNQDVDWYVMYKLPKINGEKNNRMMINGSAYAFITSAAPGPWKLSGKSVFSDSNMMANTLRDFHMNKEELTYIMYNDDPPKGFSGSANGHLKGVVAFNDETGFWLVHSIPKFVSPSSYEYPENALDNGQSVLCVTFKTESLNEICKQLRFDHPNIYEKALTDEIRKTLEPDALTIFSKRPNFVRKPPLTRVTSMRSLAGKEFVSFAKDNQFLHDLYDSVIAPGLKTSLMVETWRRGSGTILPPSCESKFDVLDVESINMTFPQRGGIVSAAFKYTEDHSKWAISPKFWICIGDMNRMESQERRGGGALCFISKQIWRAYNSIISASDTCEI
ncbi:deoxyribonuclease-2-like [Uloborus diversus]|uniref:deoxyribonuclease-2-like n=1 Tax=Uloborus diversus TaxID=327109 RepID=UPI0024093D0B|nr:deoxyribonuclease-2-like [Uloborus diversus]